MISAKSGPVLLVFIMTLLAKRSLASAGSFVAGIVATGVEPPACGQSCGDALRPVLALMRNGHKEAEPLKLYSLKFQERRLEKHFSLFLPPQGVILKRDSFRGALCFKVL